MSEPVGSMGSRAARTLSTALLATPLLAGLVGGTLSDRVAEPPTLRRGDRIGVAADLHVHAFPGDGLLAPWNLGREARRRGLHAVAITNHNQVLTARLGRFVARNLGGTLLIAGEEVSHPGYHVIALGTQRAIDWRRSPREIVAAIHAQGGVAIAAHPSRAYWSSFDEPTLRALDGAERAHPIVSSAPTSRPHELEVFFQRARDVRAAGRPFAGIGASDFHGFAALGSHRTIVWTRELSQAGILAAIREGRTEALAIAGPAAGPSANTLPPLRRTAGFLGLFGLVLLLAFAPDQRQMKRSVK